MLYTFYLYCAVDDLVLALTCFGLSALAASTLKSSIGKFVKLFSRQRTTSFAELSELLNNLLTIHIQPGAMLLEMGDTPAESADTKPAPPPATAFTLTSKIRDDSKIFGLQTRWFYPNHPKEALIFAAMLITSLYLFGAYSLTNMILALGGALLVPYELFRPFSQTVRYIQNLLTGRKQAKSAIGLVSIGAGLILGGLLALWLPTVVPGVIAGLSSLQAAWGIDLMVMACSVFALTNVFRQLFISPMMSVLGGYSGFALSLAIYPLLPIDPATSFAFLVTMGVASLVSIAAKFAMRIYYRSHYGHSDADGYENMRQESDATQAKREAQATILNVPIHKFVVTMDTLTRLIDAVPTIIKADAAAAGVARQIKDSLKMVYKALATATTPDEVRDAKHLYGEFVHALYGHARPMDQIGVLATLGKNGGFDPVGFISTYYLHRRALESLDSDMLDTIHDDKMRTSLQEQSARQARQPYIFQSHFDPKRQEQEVDGFNRAVTSFRLRLEVARIIDKTPEAATAVRALDNFEDTIQLFGNLAP